MMTRVLVIVLIYCRHELLHLNASTTGLSRTHMSSYACIHTQTQCTNCVTMPFLRSQFCFVFQQIFPSIYITKKFIIIFTAPSTETVE